MTIATALRKIADNLRDYADEIEAGHVVPSDDLRLEARRITIQADDMDEGLHE